jgi:hypothetical protein|tara:strand:- start:499 stop:744 length:246 start_codon:yes stop_codon:yes gene_type:complete
MSKIFKIMSEQNNNPIITQCVDTDDYNKSWTEAGQKRSRAARDKIRLALIQARKEGEAGDESKVLEAAELRLALKAFDAAK